MDEYGWGSYEADASLTIVNVTAAVSDRPRAKRPPRLTAYAYVQHRAAPGVTRHYRTFAACYLSRVRENERSWSAAQPGEMLPPWTMGHGRLSVGASFRARLVVFPAFGSVQRRSREEYPPTTPCICDSLNEHRLTGGERHGLGLNLGLGLG